MNELTLEEEIELIKSDIKILEAAQEMINRRFWETEKIRSNSHLLELLEKELDICERALEKFE